MTAKEYFDKWNLEHYYEPNNLNNVINIMNDYAEQKCKELLEIVVKKAYAQVEYDCAVIEKDSILNAVDLKDFIK